jgi:hypothetical protein
VFIVQLVGIPQSGGNPMKKKSQTLTLATSVLIAMGVSGSATAQDTGTAYTLPQPGSEEYASAEKLAIGNLTDRNIYKKKAPPKKK